MTLALSVLDLAPIPSGATASGALNNTLELARHAEALGYHRYWLAEHHNMAGLASAAPEILIGQVARETTTLRVGSGGIMLPNQAPLKVAESFKTLEALFPGRIDLGIGRAPGSDQRTALALRRGAGSEDLPEQLHDLFAFAGGGFPEGHPFASVTAAPVGVDLPPVWLLGSSDFSARVAGRMGLGFVFAQHINPYGAREALDAYRAEWTHAGHTDAPRPVVTVSAIVADTDAEADTLATSMDLAWLRLAAGKFGPFPSAAEAQAHPYTFREQMAVRESRQKIILGSPATVRARLCTLSGELDVPELIVTTMVHDHAARLRSYALLAEAVHGN